MCSVIDFVISQNGLYCNVGLLRGCYVNVVECPESGMYVVYATCDVTAPILLNCPLELRTLLTSTAV
jgi:hypothetical protein